MALSKDDQRTLDEMERALREDDPRFAGTVSFDHQRRHRSVVGGSIFVLGIALLLVGEMASQVQLAAGVLIGLSGFLVMFAAIAWMVRQSHHT